MLETKFRLFLGFQNTDHTNKSISMFVGVNSRESNLIKRMMMDSSNSRGSHVLAFDVIIVPHQRMDF